MQNKGTIAQVLGPIVDVEFKTLSSRTASCPPSTTP